jgi:hypothetical protein
MPNSITVAFLRSRVSPQRKAAPHRPKGALASQFDNAPGRQVEILDRRARRSTKVVRFRAVSTAARALRTNPKVLVQLRQRTPVARSTLLKLLRRMAALHPIGTTADKMVVDTRSS